MNELNRCSTEQAAAAAYLSDPARLSEYCERHGCSVESARAGAVAGVLDWAVEGMLVRREGLC